MPETKIITAKSQRNASKHLHYGNMISLVIPVLALGMWFYTDNILWAIPAVPPLVFWFGMSMVIYAIHRHHPNPKVQAYTITAGRWYYALVSPIVAGGIFIEPEYAPMIIGGLFVTVTTIIVIKGMMEIRKINKDDWQDIELPAEA
jgi:hypothetical protein